MPHLYETKLWRLQLPDTWRVRDRCGQELVTFFRPDGIGLLSVLTHDDHPPVPEGRGEDFRGRLTGKTSELKYGERFSRTWALSCRGQRLYIRYECSAENAELERLEVDEILQSISEAA